MIYIVLTNNTQLFRGKRKSFNNILITLEYNITTLVHYAYVMQFLPLRNTIFGQYLLFKTLMVPFNTEDIAVIFTVQTHSTETKSPAPCHII